MPPHREEKKERAAVPQFGAWDQKAGGGGGGGGGEFTGYSVVFSKAREKRKQTKVEVPAGETSAQGEFGPPHGHDDSNGPRPHHHPHSHSDPPNMNASRPYHPRRHSHSHSSDKDEPPKQGMKKLLMCFSAGPVRQEP